MEHTHQQPDSEISPAEQPQSIVELKEAIQQQQQQSIEAATAPILEAAEVVSNGGPQTESVAMNGHAEAQVEQTAVVTETAPATPISTPATPSTEASKVLTPLIKEQLKYCNYILRGMKRHNQATPFLVPVDPVALGIPDYPTVITHPMDLSTIQKKLDGAEYESPEQFHADVKLMFNNCYTYNKPETQVYVMGKALEKYFDNSYPKMPTELSAASTDFGGSRRKSDIVTRPRRESAAVPRAPSVIPAVPAGRAKRPSPEITFCVNTWKELTKKSNLNISWPFLEPVDPVKLGIPDYFNIVKNPMDLSTVKKKLDAGAYQTAAEFEADIRLIFQNCYLYNGIESEVSRLGRELEAVFDKKWAAKPQPLSPGAYDEYDPDAEKIAALSKQIQTLQKELDELLAKRQHRPVHQPKATAASAKQQKKAAPAAPAAPAPMTFEEKQQLSIDVNNLDPEKLLRVVEIIQNSTKMPEAESDVIELDIESLDVSTLRQLQKYVAECKGLGKKRKPASSGPRPKKAATGQTGAEHHLAAAAAPVTPALEESISSDDSSSSDDDMA